MGLSGLPLFELSFPHVQDLVQKSVNILDRHRQAKETPTGADQKASLVSARGRMLAGSLILECFGALDPNRSGVPQPALFCFMCCA